MTAARAGAGPGQQAGQYSTVCCTDQSLQSTAAFGLHNNTKYTSKQNIDTNNNRVQTGSSDIGSDVKSRLRR